MSEGLAERFGGIAQLYGVAGLVRFQVAHVAVVGIGGVGSWIAEALARSGIGEITLLDLDDICISNTNRQVHTVDRTIGQPKVKAMAERLRAISPEVIVHDRAAFYTESTAQAFFDRQFSIVVDAIDSVRQKAHLIAEARLRTIAVVTVGGAGGRVDPTRIQIADLSETRGDRLLSLTRKQLRAHHQFPRPGSGKFKVRAVFSDEVPRWPQPDGSVCETKHPDTTGGLDCANGLGSATHITASMGLFAVSEVLRQLSSMNKSTI